jgi:hypothetical protein
MQHESARERPLSGAIDAARQALGAAYAGRRPAQDPERQRETELLQAIGEGDDGAFVYRMLLAAWGREPAPEQFSDRVATLRAGAIDRYELLDREVALSDAGGTPSLGAVDTGHFLGRDLFDLAEFEAFGPEDFVTAACCACLRRKPDRFLLGHYLGLLQAGRMSRGEVLGSLLESDEARQRGLGTVILGVSGGLTERRLTRALAELHRRNERLDYLVGYLYAQQHRLAARLALMEAGAGG